ncbi:MAG: hypothetical protein AAGF20_11240 [Pseudomonadota bacterium]
MKATLLLYLACVVFWEVNAKRTAFAAVKESPRLQRGGLAVGWVIALSALVLLISLRGPEIAIFQWLIAFPVAGVISVLIASLAKKAHLASAGLSLFALISLIIVSVVGGQG